MSEDTTTIPANLVPPDAGMVRLPDGSQMPEADAVQGPSDILTQYKQDTIPEQFPEAIERNRVAGLDAKGHPIPGAPLSPAAEKVMAYEASLVTVPVEVPAPVAVNVSAGVVSTEGETTHLAVPVAHISEFSKIIADIESIPQHVRDFWHQHFGQHV